LESGKKTRGPTLPFLSRRAPPEKKNKPVQNTFEGGNLFPGVSPDAPEDNCTTQARADINPVGALFSPGDEWRGQFTGGKLPRGEKLLTLPRTEWVETSRPPENRRKKTGTI